MENNSEDYVNLLSKAKVGGTSKVKHELIFKQRKGKLDMVFTHFDVVTSKRKEVETVSMSVVELKRLKYLIDMHVKLFDSY